MIGVIALSFALSGYTLGCGFAYDALADKYTTDDDAPVRVFGALGWPIMAAAILVGHVFSVPWNLGASARRALIARRTPPALPEARVIK